MQHSQDEYYYRPLVSGAQLFTYVAHVRAGGFMPPSQEEAEMFELSLVMIDGELVAILGEDELTLHTWEALHISFAPPARAGSIDDILKAAAARGRHVYSPQELGDIVGETSFPLTCFGVRLGITPR